MLMLINRYWKILWLRSTGTFKDQTGIPLKLFIEKLISLEEKSNRANLADLSPRRYDEDETKHIPSDKL